jgi:hypothetical protein
VSWKIQQTLTSIHRKMKKSRIALVLLAVAAFAAVGFSAAGSNASANKAGDCCGAGCANCASCCHK